MSVLGLLKHIALHPLNRGRPIGALGRFVRWQIGSRLVPGEVIYPWMEGAKFIVRRGEHGLTGNIYTGLQEYADMAYWLHVARREDLFADIGANSGAYSILAGAVVGARGYAFEPVPATYRRLVGNVRVNHMEARVACRNLALGDRRGSLAFTRDQDATNHVVAPGEEANDSISVEVETLDAALAGECPGMIKIDVEGYELAVLEGAAATLRDERLHSVIVELNGSGRRYDVDESRIPEMLRDLGFSPSVYHPEGRELRPIQGKNPASGNTLFVRNRAFVRERLASAPAFRIHGRSI